MTENVLHLQSSQSEAHHRATILLVEDEDFVRNVTREVLELEGYRVFEAVNAETGDDLYTEHHDIIDLLITDVVMPGLNGREFANKLIARNGNLKVIFMSGYIDNAIVREGFADVRLHYLQKPFTLDALTAIVSQILKNDASAPN